MAEKIDIYNANLEHQGFMDRVQAHLEGKWHLTFHCWVVSNYLGGSILFQARSPEMVNFPNMLDVSAAGHLEAGESLEQGIREVSEELGVAVSIADLHFLGHRVEVADQTNGQKNREYQAVYILNSNQKLENYSPQIEEVSGLLWIKLDDGLKLFSGGLERAHMEGISYSTAKKEWVKVTREVSIEDFLPRIQRYYLTACIMGQRAIENKFPLSIS